jgi:hypothetical protein
MNNRTEPTYENQIWHAKRLLKEQGYDALNNPHAMIGRTCKCGTCFCCAAAEVARKHSEKRTPQ